MKEREKRIVCLCLYILILILASIPIMLNYIMAGGEISDWIARIEDGESGLWFFLPSMVYQWKGNMAAAYQVNMFVIQLGTLLTSVKFFRSIFGKERAVIFGVLLYMTSPYRLYVCYDQADLLRAVVWMLLPLYAGTVADIVCKRNTFKNCMIASVALAGIGYADGVMMVIIACISILAVIVTRQGIVLISLAMGGLLFLPGGIRLIKYLFLYGTEIMAAPVQSMAGQGYTIGRFLTSFAYEAGKPGLGWGLILSLIVLAWFHFVTADVKLPKEVFFFLIISLLLLICSLQYFPWDIVQRFGSGVFKLVQLIKTPAVFFGFACFGLCVPASWAMEKISAGENKIIAAGVPLIIISAAAGVSVYLCNILTYTRFPME